METLRADHVVLVSPSDVAQERQAFEDAIANANQVAFRRGVVFELRRWEDVSPGYHEEGAEALINCQLNIEQCDLLVGIFWNRFGVVDKPHIREQHWRYFAPSKRGKLIRLNRISRFISVIVRLLRPLRKRRSEFMS